MNIEMLLVGLPERIGCLARRVVGDECKHAVAIDVVPSLPECRQIGTRQKRQTLPILSNVLIEAGKGELKLTATDLDIEIVEALPADVLRNGSATAPAESPVGGVGETTAGTVRVVPASVTAANLP